MCLDTEDQMVWTGAWDAPRGDSSRYIFRFRRRYSAQMAVGHRLGFISCAVECKGDGVIVPLARNRPVIHRCLPKRRPLLSAPSAPLQLGDDPGTRDLRPPSLCDDGARCLPCRFAQMELAAMSRRACITTQSASKLQAPHSPHA